jgi:hypothetical protein
MRSHASGGHEMRSHASGGHDSRVVAELAEQQILSRYLSFAGSRIANSATSTPERGHGPPDRRLEADTLRAQR